MWVCWVEIYIMKNKKKTIGECACVNGVRNLKFWIVGNNSAVEFDNNNQGKSGVDLFWRDNKVRGYSAVLWINVKPFSHLSFFLCEAIFPGLLLLLKKRKIDARNLPQFVDVIGPPQKVKWDGTRKNWGKKVQKSVFPSWFVEKVWGRFEAIVRQQMFHKLLYECVLFQCLIIMWNIGRKYNGCMNKCGESKPLARNLQ